MSLEPKEEWGEENELQSSKHLEAIKKRCEKMNDIIGVVKKNQENNGSSGLPVFESQPLSQGIENLIVKY